MDETLRLVGQESMKLYETIYINIFKQKQFTISDEKEHAQLILQYIEITYFL